MKARAIASRTATAWGPYNLPIMTTSLPLFDDLHKPQPLQLPDADLRLVRRFYEEDEAQRHFAALKEELAWRHEPITLWGKQYLQPRLTAWYGEPGTDYTYSGLRMEPLPWTPRVAGIKAAIEALCGQRFNSVLANLYRDERDSVGWHSDDEPELGKTPFIASLSLGETRIFKLRHKTRKEIKPVSFELGNGSLLLMGGRTQQHWLHAVEKERQTRGARINLTFRLIQTSTRR